MIILLAKIVHWVFLVFTVLLLVRIVGSWVPRFAFHPVMRLSYRVTEPYLGIFRRLIPPIGGALDLSPMLAFFALQILEKLIMGILGGLI